MDSRMVMEYWNVERGGLASWLELWGAEGQQVRSALGVDRKWSVSVAVLVAQRRR